MSLFDILYFRVFEFYRNRKNKKAASIAWWYISLFQSALVLVVGILLAEFIDAMQMRSMDAEKAWTVFFLVTLILFGKNYVQYNGKKRNVLRAQISRQNLAKPNIISLWAILTGTLGLAFVLFKLFQ